jgi:flagellar biosynthesis/type III secretory pathway ATPase
VPNPLIEKATLDWMTSLARIGSESKQLGNSVVEGVLTRMVGLTLEAVGCQAPIGARCDVVNSTGDRVETEVVGFSGDSLYLMPTAEVRGLVPRTFTGTPEVSTAGQRDQSAESNSDS